MSPQAHSEAQPPERQAGGGGSGGAAQVVATQAASATSDANNNDHSNSQAGNQKCDGHREADSQRPVQLTGTLKTTNSELTGQERGGRDESSAARPMGNATARLQESASDASSSATLESAGSQVEVGRGSGGGADHQASTAAAIRSAAEGARPLDAGADPRPDNENGAEDELRRQDRPRTSSTFSASSSSSSSSSSSPRARREREQVAAPAQQVVGAEVKRRPSQDSPGDAGGLVNLDEQQRAKKCDANESAKSLLQPPPPATATTTTTSEIDSNSDKQQFNQDNQTNFGPTNKLLANQITSNVKKISPNQAQDGGQDQQHRFELGAHPDELDDPTRRFDFKPAVPKRLSFLQSLLLRRWPCLPLAICIMSSLLFGILLSGLTVYLMHGVDGGHCNELGLLMSGKSSPVAAPADGSQHDLRRQPHLPQVGSSLLPHELLVGSPDSPPVATDPAGGEPDAELTHRHAAATTSAATAAAAVAPAASASSTQVTAAGATQAQAFQRLPSSVVPQHYELFIWPHIAEPTFHFNGSVDIYLSCKQPTDNITLHTLDLTVNETSLRVFKLAQGADPQQQLRAVPSQAESSRLAAASSPRVVRMSQDKQLQYSIVHLDSKLEPGQSYLLRMDFVGFLNDDLAGFYKIKYERPNSSEITWIAATQFQATDARRAFPCFDEPHYKATFGIRLRHWRNMTALSNMQIVATEESPDGLWITDTFARSQRMSTYLVAFAVTNFESRTNGNITVWTRPGLVHTADYALSIAGKILRYYEDYFGIAYPLPKMDMIALPDFNAGAMENWGLITYRETAMLYDEKTSSVANKQRVAVVVAHELAHQWFGNLVTPKWWDDLWLNEGFASFVEYIGVDHVEPKWRMLDQFVVDEMQDVLDLDGLSSSHQISIPVNNPDEISEIFDHISYSKGASIIRMMNHFLTERVFNAGLQRYLQALKYDNAEQSDLWAHLTEAQRMFAQGANASSSGGGGKTETNSSVQSTFEPIDVSKVMNSWTLQTGYPLVTLTRDYASNTATLGQLRYRPYKLRETRAANSSEVAAAANDDDQRWEIPITYTWKSEQNWTPVTRLWMHQNQSGPVQLSGRRMPRAPSEWMLVNVQQVGYYRVNYDLQNWNLLIEQLRADHSKITTANRAQLLDDLFELAKSSRLDYQLAMEATRYLKAEREYLPWESVLQSFGYIDEMLLRTPVYGDWQDYFAQLLAPHYERYKDADWTWPRQPPAGSANGSNADTLDADNDVLEQYNQVNAVSWACALNNQHCIQKAVAVFKRYRSTGVNNIKPAFRHRTYCTGIEYGTKDDWDFLWRVYEKEQAPSERDRILRALGCSRELWILSRYLEWTFSKSKPIRRQDGAFVFRLVAKNKHGREIAFNFMRERWATIKEYYGKSTFSLGSLIKSVATSMNSQLELDQLRAFYESIKGDVGTGKRSFQIAIEEVESNVAWRTKNYKILEDWLQKQKQTSSRAMSLAQTN